MSAPGGQRIEDNTKDSDPEASPLAGATTPVVNVQNLHKRYGEIVAVNNLTFSIPRGELVVIVGPNGAGKTTLVEICEGLRDPESGSVTLFGQSPRSRDVKRRMGVQLDSASFHKHLEVGQILALFARLYQRQQPSQEVVEVLELAIDESVTTVEILKADDCRRVVGNGS